MLPVRKENFYLDLAAADRPPDNLNRYGAGDTSLLRPKPRAKKFSNALAWFRVYS